MYLWSAGLIQRLMLVEQFLWLLGEGEIGMGW